MLSEQHTEYLVQQLQLYASGERRNDVYGRMRIIAAKLTSAEILGLARNSGNSGHIRPCCRL
jgi:cytochrome c553